MDYLIKTYDPEGQMLPIAKLEEEVTATNEQVKQFRKQKWKDWCEEKWINSQGKLYRWVRQTAPGKNSFQSQELHKLHAKSWDPSVSLTERLGNTEGFWNGLWTHGDPMKSSRSSPSFPG